MVDARWDKSSLGTVGALRQPESTPTSGACERETKRDLTQPRADIRGPN